MDREFHFELEGLKCTAYFKKGETTMIKVPEKMMRFSLELFRTFKKNGYTLTTVGMKGIPPLHEPVQAEKPRKLIKIGCIDVTEEQFNKLYKLLIFKENEFRKS